MSEIYHSPIDYSVPFDNIGTDFVSENVHDAIIEAKQNAEGFPRAGLALTYNSTVGSGSFITYSELLSNKAILFPVKIRLKEITWVNANVDLGDFHFEIYVNGTDPANLVYTMHPTASDLVNGYGYDVLPVIVDVPAGGRIYIKYTNTGKNIADLALVLWIARTK